MAKLRVAVLMGGPSSEREVSLRSGAMILKNLDPAQYDAFVVDLSDLLGAPEALIALAARADFVFLALHGGIGEDGTVQGLLEMLGLPYNGSGVMASAIAMNKVRAKAVYREVGLPQARSLDLVDAGNGWWRRGLSPLFPPNAGLLTRDEIAELVASTLGWDLVIKGASQGSTLGLAIVKDPADFWAAMAATAAYDPEILIEERIAGIEVTAGVLGNAEVVALPLVEIRPKKGLLFDYEAKYTAGASEELCPAPSLDEATTARVQELAVAAHQALGCWGLSRSDFLVKDGIPYILETNTLPGFTEQSLLPMAARASGLMMPELLDKLIHWGLERRVPRQAAGRTAAS